MTRPLGETEFEETTIERLERLGYEYLHAQTLFQRGERSSLQEVILFDRFETCISDRYPTIPKEEVKRLAQVFTSPDGVTLEQRNMDFHRMLTKGIEFTYEVNDETFTPHVYPINWGEPLKNDFLVVNQLSIDGRMSRRPDVIVYINGLPLIVFELKNPNREDATVYDAYTQIRNYTEDISQLFNYNAFTVISDNIETKHGMPSADYDFFASWKSINGQTVDNNVANTMKTLIEGMFPKDRLLNYIKNFIVFLEEGSKLTKIGAKYHQYFGVNFAVQETIRATQLDGDRKIGVMYHTTGSGKSLSMLFYAGILSRSPQLENPSIVVQVDRNDLDEQLHDTFIQGKTLIGHVHHAQDTDELRSILKGEAGQIIFSTIEKFRKIGAEKKHPVLSDRRNLVVIADEAHRTQSGFDSGFAAQLRFALPNGSHIAFTGTPVDFVGNNTEEIFGHIIHRYDMAQSVADKSTLPLYYENRLIPLDRSAIDIDEGGDEILMGTGDEESEVYKRKWVALEKVVGTPKRLKTMANDIVGHFNNAANPLQKGMIVCMSRRIAVHLYNQIRTIPDCPPIEVIMTGKVSKDPKEWREKQPGSDYSHIKTKKEQEDVKASLRDPDDPLKMVIVVDMWLTGMDSKPLSFLYVDKPIRGHNIIQAIARVNRVFPGKEGGIIVDYIGIADSLREATNKYTQTGGAGKPTHDLKEEGLRIFHHNLDEARKYIPSSVDITNWRQLPKIDREDLIAELVNMLLNSDNKQFVQDATKLEKSYLLVKYLPELYDLADEVILYLMLKVQVRKHIGEPRTGSTENKTLEERLSTLIDDSLLAKEPVDIFKVAGIDRPDISILDEAFLADLTKKDHGDLRMKLLKKLLEDQIQVTFKKNSTKSKRLSELLEKTLKDYHNRVISAADFVWMLIKTRQNMDEEVRKRHDLGLEDEEIEFYKAITAMEHEALSNEFLADIIRKVVKALKKQLDIDWTSPHRQDVYAKVKLAVKMVLTKEKVDKQQFQFLTNKFMEQAEQQYKDWPNNG